MRIVSLQHGSEPGGKLVGNIRCHYKWPPCLITDLSTAGHLHSFLLWTASKSSDPTSHFSSPQKEASHLRHELDSFCRQGQLLILSLTSSLGQVFATFATFFTALDSFRNTQNVYSTMFQAVSRNFILQLFATFLTFRYNFLLQLLWILAQNIPLLRHFYAKTRKIYHFYAIVRVRSGLIFTNMAYELLIFIKESKKITRFPPR